LQIASWADALDRLRRLDAPAVVIDELPYLIGTATAEAMGSAEARMRRGFRIGNR
jgi:hypothetical protein